MATNRRLHPPDPRIAQRLAAILAYHKVKPSELADRIGIDRASVSQWLSGTTAMTDKNAHRVAKALKEDPEFVLCRKDTAAAGYGAALQSISEIFGGDLIRRMLDMDPEVLRAKAEQIVKDQDDLGT